MDGLQMACVASIGNFKSLDISLFQSIQAEVGMFKLIHLLERDTGKQTEKTPHGASVHTDQEVLLV